MEFSNSVSLAPIAQVTVHFYGEENSFLTSHEHDVLCLRSVQRGLSSYRFLGNETNHRSSHASKQLETSQRKLAHNM